MIRLTNNPEALGSGSLVVGYARVAYEDGANLIRYREQIARHASHHGLLLSTTFTDFGSRPPFTRPGFRALVDVVRTLHPSGLVVPDPRHLSANPPELRHVLALLRDRGCAVLVVDGRTTVMLAAEKTRGGVA